MLALALPLPLSYLIHAERTSAQENGGLPAGAKQFSQVITAQRQWKQVPDAFKDGREPDDAEWENLRTYLRAVYAVSMDMAFLTKRFEKETRDKVGRVITSFKGEVKAMDKPALKKDAAAFLQGHKKVEMLFDEFFGLLQEQTVGDMPAEL